MNGNPVICGGKHYQRTSGKCLVYKEDERSGQRAWKDLGSSMKTARVDSGAVQLDSGRFWITG